MPTRAEGLDLRVNSPCEADWDSMVGNEEVRFCTHCEKSVRDISAMTRKDAMRFVRANAGGVCVRFYSAPSGRTLHADEGRLHRITRRASKAAVGAFSAVVALSSTAHAQSYGPADVERAAASDASRSDASKQQESQQETSKTGETGGREITELPLRPENEPRRNVTMGLMVRIRPEDPLVRAIADRDTRAAKNLIALGANVNVIDKNVHTTALIEAVMNGNAEIVSELVSAGADVNMKDTEGDTPLTTLTEESTVELVRTLINAGAKINHRNNSGQTPIMHAAESDTPEVLKELIEAGAKVNAKDKSGRTALLNAAQYGILSNIKLLLDAGADVNAKDEDGNTVLYVAKELLASTIDAEAEGDDSNKSKEDKEPKESEEVGRLKKVIELLVSYGAIE